MTPRVRAVRGNAVPASALRHLGSWHGEWLDPETRRWVKAGTTYGPIEYTSPGHALRGAVVACDQSKAGRP